MYFKGKKILFTGANSFIGGALYNELFKLGAYLIDYDDDIREGIFIEKPSYQVDYVFHFGSPSSQVLFNRKPEYCIDTTINGFKSVLGFCRNSGAKLIYPSTGLLSCNKPVLNEYAMCKYLCEKQAEKSGVETLGLRIFAGYGPGEEHKRDYKSVIGLFLDDVVAGKNPVIYGDGEQKRDFIYIDDIVDSVLKVVEDVQGVVNIGSGVSHSFNEIIKIIKSVTSKDFGVFYVKKPINYIEETVCKNTTFKTSLANGIKKYYEQSYRNDNNS